MTEGRPPRSLCLVLPTAGNTSQDNLKILSSNLKLGRVSFFVALMTGVFQNTSFMVATDNADSPQLFLQLVATLSKTAFNNATFIKLSYKRTEFLRSGMF